MPTSRRDMAQTRKRAAEGVGPYGVCGVNAPENGNIIRASCAGG